MSRKSSENALWQALKKRMDAGKAHAVRIEDKLAKGTPDVDYCAWGGEAAGWIELKHLDAFPVYHSTSVWLPHYTKEQAIWAFKRDRAGGNSWLLARVGKEVYLFPGSMARTVQKGLNQEDFIAAAYAVGWDAVMKTLGVTQ